MSNIIINFSNGSIYYFAAQFQSILKNSNHLMASFYFQFAKTLGQPQSLNRKFYGEFLQNAVKYLKEY